MSSQWMICCVYMTYQQCQVDAALPGLSCNMHDMSRLHLLTFSRLSTSRFLCLTELMSVSIAVCLRPLIVARPLQEVNFR